MVHGCRRTEQWLPPLVNWTTPNCCRYHNSYLWLGMFFWFYVGSLHGFRNHEREMMMNNVNPCHWTSRYIKIWRRVIFSFWRKTGPTTRTSSKFERENNIKQTWWYALNNTWHWEERFESGSPCGCVLYLWSSWGCSQGLTRRRWCVDSTLIWMHGWFIVDDSCFGPLSRPNLKLLPHIPDTRIIIRKTFTPLFTSVRVLKCVFCFFK